MTEGTQVLTLRVSNDGMAALDELAVHRKEDRSTTVRVMLTYALKHAAQLPAPTPTL